MARQDSTNRSRAGRHRWLGVSDARSRLCMVRSGRGDRGCESPYRPAPAALYDGAADAFGRTPDLAASGLKMAAPQPEPKQAAQPSRQAMSNRPQSSAWPGVLRITPRRSGAEYWTMRCVKCGSIHLDIVKAAATTPAPVQESSDLHV